MRRNNRRGEGMVGILIVIVLIVLASVVAAQKLGGEIIKLIMGTEEGNAIMEGKIDNVEIGNDPNTKKYDMDKDKYPWLPK